MSESGTVGGASGSFPEPRLTTIAVTGPWTIDSLLVHFTQRLDAMENASRLSFEACAALTAEMDRRYEQRYQEDMAARAFVLQERDMRYQQRFDAQQHAVSLALTQVDKEFHEHIRSVREETTAALNAADKAITKSEAASEKRFESVNEFRAQLAYQATSFMPRVEAEQRVGQSTEKIESLATRHAQDMAQINSRLDLTQGQSGGAQRVQATIFAVVAAFVGVAGLTVAIITNAR